MILLDYSPVAIANLMIELHGPDKKEYLQGKKLNSDLVRHMIFNSIRGYNVKFRKEYGEMVICCDDIECWRKEIFPFYKSKRKEDKDDSEVDWADIYRVLNLIKKEVAEFSPYKVLQVEAAEADDIIAVLARTYAEYDRVLIISGDKDFQQLQAHRSVRQYAPVKKDFIVCKNPGEFLKEQIIRGDSGDSVPNFLSPDNSFVDKIRQKQILQKKLDVWLGQSREDICGADPVLLKNWERNVNLIDFDRIPSGVEYNIKQAYNQPPLGSKTKLLNHMMACGMVVLLDSIQDF